MFSVVLAVIVCQSLQESNYGRTAFFASGKQGTISQTSGGILCCSLQAESRPRDFSLLYLVTWRGYIWEKILWKEGGWRVFKSILAHEPESMQGRLGLLWYQGIEVQSEISTASLEASDKVCSLLWGWFSGLSAVSQQTGFSLPICSLTLWPNAHMLRHDKSQQGEMTSLLKLNMIVAVTICWKHSSMWSIHRKIPHF